MLLGTYLGTSGLQKYWGNKVDINYNDTKLPTICWLAYGLNYNQDRPGSYTSQFENYHAQNGYVKEYTQNEAKTFIDGILNDFKNKPSLIFRFYSQKFLASFTSPTYDCFDYYQKKDSMNGDNQMYCNKCEDMKDAFYGTTLYLAPKILIINLNRGKGGIDEFNVTFPEDLNISDYVINKKGPKIFELFAVINHYGPRLLGGYFAAFCKNRLDDNWYFYKNEKVTKSYETNGYLKGTPYILFYRKK